MTADLLNRFTYHPPNEDQKKLYENIRAHVLQLAEHLDNIVPDSREKSTALTHLQSAQMWFNAAIACNKIGEVLYLREPTKSPVAWSKPASEIVVLPPPAA